jgi:RNA polymerase sigma factor (sigma-70 family)
MSVVCKVQRCFVTRQILSQIGFDQISLERLAQQLMWHAIAMLGVGPVEDAEPMWRVEPVADASLQLRDLQRAINTLCHEHREVLLLVGLEGMRYEQVATILDIPVGTVRSRLSRARTTLRLLMDGAKSANNRWNERCDDLAA